MSSKPETEAKQLASLLEIYLIRDVSKIVWQYFFDGLDAFVYGQPRFEMLLSNFTNSFLPYEEIFQENGTSIIYDSHLDDIQTYLKEFPNPCWHTSAGEMDLSDFHWNQIHLKFEENFLLKSQYGDPNNIVFFIVEKTTKQVVFSYFPYAYQKKNRDTTHPSDFYLHQAFERVEPIYEKNQFKLQWIGEEDPRLSACHQETKLELNFMKTYKWDEDLKNRSRVFDMDQIKEFTSKFSSKYPL